MTTRSQQRGLSLVEVLVALVAAAGLLVGAAPLLQHAMSARVETDARLTLNRDAHFALQRLSDAVGQTHRVFVPQVDLDETDFDESVREQYVPDSLAPLGAGGGTALLSVALGARVDTDGDGVADADNDRDGQVDEDPGGDITNDDANGVYQMDDNGDGVVDPSSFSNFEDDDEYRNFPNEDPVNGRDDDGDGSVDEDPNNDLNGDGQPGVAGVDDDGDGLIDEGNRDDDDEDGQVDEDWFDAVSFYLDDDRLIERRPAGQDVTGDGVITGRDVVDIILIEDVQYLRIARETATDNGVLIELTLTLARDGREQTVRTAIRSGSFP